MRNNTKLRETTISRTIVTRAKDKKKEKGIGAEGDLSPHTSEIRQHSMVIWSQKPILTYHMGFQVYLHSYES